MNEELQAAIDDLLRDLEEWEEECDRALQLGYSIEFAQGPYIEIHNGKLQRLRDLVRVD